MAQPTDGGDRYSGIAALDVLNGQVTTTFESVEKPVAIYESEYCLPNI